MIEYEEMFDPTPFLFNKLLSTSQPERNFNGSSFLSFVRSIVRSLDKRSLQLCTQLEQLQK